MTRKRFVKLLMGRFGYGKYWANVLAFSIRNNGSTYADELLYILKGVVK